MSKHVYVRPVEPRDSADFLAWSAATEENDFDPDVAKYPSTFVLCAYDAGGALAYLPIQQPLLIDALAQRPGLDPGTAALAMKELVHTAITQAHIKGAGEVYLLASEASAERLAGRLAGRQVFERLPLVVYRAKLSNLEGR